MNAFRSVMLGAFVFLALVFYSASTLALEVAGVKIPDSVKLENQELQLNGAGIRTRMFIKVYVGALYLVKKTNSAQAAIDDGEAKRVSMHLLRDLRAEQVASALNDGLVANNSQVELATLEPRVREFNSILISIGNAKKGDVINIDYLPGIGTRVSINGEAKGTVAGNDFNRALLKVWLGDKPVDADLKRGMIG